MAKPNKRYRIRDSETSSAPAEVVMRKIVSPHSWPQWQSEILEIEGPQRLIEGAQITGNARLLGFDVHGRSEAKEVSDHIFVEDVVVGVRMLVSYEVESSPRGTVITRTLEADLPTGLSGRVLSWLLRRRLRRMQTRLLRELSAQAEAEVSG